MRLQDIMSTEVRTIAPGASAGDALAEMRRHHIHHLVVKDGRDILGVVSSRDVESAGGSGRRGARVDSLMNAPAVVAAPRLSVRSAANLLRGRSLGCLPVVDRGEVIGIVTVTDMLELLGKGADRGAIERVRRVIRRRGPRATPQPARPLSR